MSRFMLGIAVAFVGGAAIGLIIPQPLSIIIALMWGYWVMTMIMIMDL